MSRKILRPPLPYIGAMLSLTLGHCLTLVAAIAYFSGRLYCGSLKLKQCLFSWPDFICLMLCAHVPCSLFAHHLSFVGRTAGSFRVHVIIIAMIVVCCSANNASQSNYTPYLGPPKKWPLYEIDID